MGVTGSTQPPRRAATAAVVACTLLVALLVTWAALIGPGRVLDGQGPDAVRVTPSADRAPSEVGSRPAEPGSEVGPGDLPLAISLLLAAVTIAAGLVLLALVGLGARRLWALRPPARERPEPVDFDVVEAPARMAGAIVADAAYQRAALLEGSPRNGIVQCWHRFELQAAGVGLQRLVWETSSEHALRVLELAEADPDAVSRLASLFREARFSDHEVTEAARQQAVRALEDLHAGLARDRVHR